MSFTQAVWRESVYLASLARTFWRLRGVKPDSGSTIVDIVEQWARHTPDAPAIMCAEMTLSYAALNSAADSVAHWARVRGIGRGNCVSLLMENRPEYVIAWLGLLKVGAIASLINSNLRGSALAHCVAVCETRHLIVEAELAEAYLEARPFLESPPEAWAIGGRAGLNDFSSALKAAPKTPADPRWRDDVVCADTAFYIFTSGTTGLPKAAKISHLRMLFMMHGFSAALNTRADDRVYNVLPMYHSAGGICVPGMAFTVGGTLVLRRKFSVQAFWDDCVRYRVTVFQYIGELCRYLLNAPVSPNERAHSVRAVIGNGLRPDIWDAFQERFAIPRIVEFYGATEGNVALVNYDGKTGAVGRIPRYARNLFTTRIVRFDLERESPLRDANGFCIECGDDEAGEAIGKIVEEPGKRFEGYTQKADTEKKILRHVFEADDEWFRTGDLLRRDGDGYFYFVDRIGDTFRWKGENVATSEVAEAVSAVPGVLEANVYGVAVPGHDGRAGMAALVVKPAFEPAKMAAQLAGRLPVYARPVFLRLMPEIGITGTFKHRKIDLVEEGFDPARIGNPLFVLDAQTRSYEPLDAARYADISAGRLKL
jgi:fatty-acyl-CoA synthase